MSVVTVRLGITALAGLSLVSVAEAALAADSMAKRFKVNGDLDPTFGTNGTWTSGNPADNQ